MLTVIHGGPFSSAYYQMFLRSRPLLLAQGYCLLLVNYRGSLGYGEDTLNSLLGNIGDNDVHDVGNLTLKAVEQFKDVIDAERLGVFGGSHGGFLTGHLIGHPQFKDLFKAASLWNPVLDMSYMHSSTDIPDWIYACSVNKEIKFAEITPQIKAEFFRRSPMCNVNNVKTPAQLLIGDHDLRVPPH